MELFGSATLAGYSCTHGLSRKDLWLRKNEPCVFYNEKTGVLLRDRMMVACNMPTPEELKAAVPPAQTATESRSALRKRRPVRLSGS